MANQNFIDIVKVERNGGGLSRSFCCKPLGEADGEGNVFGAEMLMNGEPSDLSGCTCTGYFVRPDGITLILSGSISGNRATVSLPSACYAREGVYSLVIKIIGSGFSETVRIVDGTVVNTTTDDVADPASTLPSLAELLAVISAAEAAAEDIEELQVSAVQITGTRYRIEVTKET